MFAGQNISSDHHIERHHQQAAADALDRATQHQKIDVRREGTQHQAAHERRHAHIHHLVGALGVRPVSGENCGDDLCRQGDSRGQGIELVAAQVIHDERHGGSHGGGLEGDQGDHPYRDDFEPRRQTGRKKHIALFRGRIFAGFTRFRNGFHPLILGENRVFENSAWVEARCLHTRHFLALPTDFVAIYCGPGHVATLCVPSPHRNPVSSPRTSPRTSPRRNYRASTPSSAQVSQDSCASCGVKRFIAKPF